MSSKDDFVVCAHCRGRYKKRGLATHIRAAHKNAWLDHETDDLSSEDLSIPTNVSSDWINNLFVRAYGVPLVNNFGGQETSEWFARWRCAMKLHGKQYSLPQGSIGRLFVSTLADEIQAVANNLISCEKPLFYCSVILQRDKMIVSGSDVRRLLKKRLDMWQNQEYDELLHEAIRCDRLLKPSRGKVDEDHKVRIFTRLVLSGKLREATRWITERNDGGILHPDTLLDDGVSVLDSLRTKHPDQVTPSPEVFETCENLPLLIDVDISDRHVEKVARCLRGSAGPSGSDAELWKSFLLRYGSHSAKLRESVASLTRHLANGTTDWTQVRALLARRGIAIDKCPGIRPIGVGEILQRLCAKIMVLVTGSDVQELCGAEQLCAGTKIGIEGAIHGITSLFDDVDTEGLLLIDARNAFNTLSRPVALWNARIYWPRCARFLFNTYTGYPLIILKNTDEVILSREGMTQGDPLAMLFYAVGILPLIKKLKSVDWKQNWYADDSSCIGKLSKIKIWLNLLMKEGPKYGYYPEPNKSCLVIKSEFRGEAITYFENMSIQIVSSHRFLGAVIGQEENKRQYVKEKIEQWQRYIKILSDVAKKSPQAAFAVVIKCLQFEWTFMQRVMRGFEEEYVPLREALRSLFIPALFGHEISDVEKELLSLPARLGGLGLFDPVERAKSAFVVSSSVSAMITLSIQTGDPLNVHDHNQWVKTHLMEEKGKKLIFEKEKNERFMAMLQPQQKRTLERIIQSKASQWLTVVPTSADNYDLSPTQFRDALALRYSHTINSLPYFCDGCGQEMSLTHSLNCKKGGLVKFGHDYLRDECAAMAKLAWNGVVVEPVVRETGNGTSALIADFKVNSFWESGKAAFFDNRIINADAPSYRSQNWDSVAKTHAHQKHHKYNHAVEDLRGSFTPLICSCDGALHVEFDQFLKRIAITLTEKWSKHYSQVLGWVRIRTQLAIIRAVSLRLRGTRFRIKPFSIEDGSAIPFHADF